jgi:hypothetical protein
MAFTMFRNSCRQGKPQKDKNMCKNGKCLRRRKRGAGRCGREYEGLILRVASKR